MRIRPLILLLMLVLTGSAAIAQTPTTAAPAAGDESPMALGFTTDLLPTVVSATEGEFGKSGQIWLGVDSLRLRLVGADIFLPDGLAANNGFTNRRITTYAFIVDKCFGERYDGWWVGTGFELWMNEMEHEDAPGQSVDWNNVAWTLGGGYTWRFWNDVFLEPWGAVHFMLTDPDVELAGRTLDTQPVSAEVSLKLGWSMDL